MMLILSIILSFNIYAYDDVYLKAMRDELKVSYEKLKNAEKHQLYFIQYQMWINESNYISSSLGSISNENNSKQAILNCDIRIGNPTLDSTHEIKGEYESYNIESVLIPVDDYYAIRTQIWNLTDKIYKDSLNRYIRVLSNKKARAQEEDEAGDFIVVQKPEIFYSTTTRENIDVDKIKDLLNKISIIAKKYDFIINSSVDFSAKLSTKYIVNSEGSEIVDGSRKYRISYSIYSRADDGTDLSRFKSYEFESISDIPAFDIISKDFDTSINELKNLLDAKNLEPVSVPAIIENRAAAVFWHEIFGHRIEGHRQKGVMQGQTFAKKIGEKIMPDFITIYDDPDIKYYAGKFLSGHYIYDDEATRAQKALLVENGVLKGFLMQRVPIKGFNFSNGHGRRSPGKKTVARQGNLIVETKNSVSYEKLKEMLIEEIKKQNKPFGIIIKDIEGGYTYTTRELPQSYTILVKYATKIYPDGKEEVVRGFNMIGTPLNTFPKIIAAADDIDVFNGVCGA